jgi:predicted nucleic acid-binding protein
MNRVCLDANIWIKVLTEEPDTLRAQKLVLRLFRERTEIIAPTMMKMEIGSILRKKWSRKLIGHEELNELWSKFLTLPIIYIQESHIYELAWEVADANKLVHLYDAIYIAISDGIPFWTADERLVNAVSKSNAILKLL